MKIRKIISEQREPGSEPIKMAHYDLLAWRPTKDQILKDSEMRWMQTLPQPLDDESPDDFNLAQGVLLEHFAERGYTILVTPSETIPGTGESFHEMTHPMEIEVSLFNEESQQPYRKLVKFIEGKLGEPVILQPIEPKKNE